MIYGYIRVSTDKQTTENQHYEIEEFCKKNNMHVDEWIEETISSTANLDKRKLGKLIKKIKKDDLIIASELSRLGRNLLQVMGMLNKLLDTDARVWTIKDGYKLGDDISSKVLAFAFGLSAEIERKMISQRTKEALAARKASGMTLGRPVGSKSSYLKLTGKERNILYWIEQGKSKTAIAKKLHVDRETVRNFINNVILTE